MQSAGSFPAVDSNLKAEALVEQVVPLYALGEVRRCRLHSRGLNDTYRLETGDGGLAFLRVYLAGRRTLKEIETELLMLQHLARAGVRVSLPLERRDGGVLTALQCHEGRRWAVLFTAAPGKEVAYDAYDEDLAALYGTSAGALHEAADAYRGPKRRPELMLPLLLERPLSLLLAEVRHRREDLRFLEALGETLRRSVAALSDADVGFCHGDLHGQNACEKDGVFTFYDFDCSGWGYRAYDLSVFPWVFALRQEEPERIVKMSRAFLGGYQGSRPISPGDLAAIPTFVAIREIWLLGLHIGLAERSGWDWLSDSYFDRHLRVLRSWQDGFLDRPAADWLEVVSP